MVKRLKFEVVFRKPTKRFWLTYLELDKNCRMVANLCPYHRHIVEIWGEVWYARKFGALENTQDGAAAEAETF